LTAFGLVNRRHHGLVNTHLYHEKLPRCSKDVLDWFVDENNEDALAQCLKANILKYVDQPITSKILQRAIVLGLDRILECLIENGITSIVNEYKSRQADPPCYLGSPLSLAVLAGQITVARVLVVHEVDDFHSPENKELPVASSSTGNIAMITYLVEEIGLDPNMKDDDGDTPLAVAAELGQTRAVELLLEQGANPNLAAKRDKSPLILAAMYGHVETVRVLLSHGADVDTAVDEGHPIFCALYTSGGDKVTMTRMIAEVMNHNLLCT
jgi:hypothetical protein